MEDNTAGRVGGAAGFLFAAGVLFQNGFLLAGAPLPSATLEQVAQFYRSNGDKVSLACGWVALNIPLLVLFGATLKRRMSGHARAEPWASMGFGGVTLLAATFSATTWLQATLAARIDHLVAVGQLQLLWDLHSAAFASSGVALSVTLIGLSMGALHAGPVPRAVAALGLAGAAALVVSGLMMVGTVKGGPGIFFQLAGFTTWVVWLLTASWKLMRGAPAAAMPAGSAPTLG